MTNRTLLLAAIVGLTAAQVGLADEHGGEGECVIRKVTPNWQPGTPGEWGDTLGILAASHHGRYVAYSSYTTLFLPDADQMQGHIQQIIVRDSFTQEGELISAAYNPKRGETISANAHCEWYLDMSPNGRYVAFVSLATNLVPEDVSGEFYQVYVRDRDTQTTYLASKSTDGEVANDWGSDVRIGVSNDGKVAFASRGNNLHPEQPDTMWAVYVHDVHTGVTELVSRDVDGNAATIDSWGPAISADGNVVAFVSIAPLVPGLPFAAQDVYVRDLVAGTTEIVSIDPDGNNRPGGGGHYPRLSYDGNSVAFRYDTFGEPLDPDFPPGYADVIYARDREKNQTIGVSKSIDNQPVAVNPEGGFTISGDGTYVAWDTIEQVTNDPVNSIWHVYRTNLETAEVNLTTIDIKCQPIPEQHDIMYSAISGDGNHVVFNSMWNVLYEDDFDWSRHLYVWTDPDAQKPGIPGDLDGSGTVDGADLAILLGAWGACADCGDCPADLDGNCKVDGADLAILLGNWG